MKRRVSTHFDNGIGKSKLLGGESSRIVRIVPKYRRSLRVLLRAPLRTCSAYFSLTWSLLVLVVSLLLVVHLAFFYSSATKTTTTIPKLRQKRQQQPPQPLPSFTPKLRLAVNTDSRSGTDDANAIQIDDWEWPVIHIVHTRFMQEQANLTHLGAARLALFNVFSLPTMARQSAQSFLWIIRTDPNLDHAILEELQQQLAPYPNFFLVASNNNFRINERFPGAWRGGAETRDLATSAVYTGNQTLLEIAMALSEHLPVLETRLDADDGLHHGFIEVVQEQALRRFSETLATGTRLKWLYWCARRSIEWYWEDEYAASPSSSAQIFHGTLKGVQYNDLCITPGITVGFPVGTTAEDVPIHAHHLLVVNIQTRTPVAEACGLPVAADCLLFVEDFVFEAVRARTPTSAGMLNIGLDINHDDETTRSAWLQKNLQDMLHSSFGVLRQKVNWVNQYISDHLVDIAYDNLMGQCTTGHSCKDKAKKSLESIIASRHAIK